MEIFREGSYTEMNRDVSSQTTAHVTALHYYSKEEQHKIAIYTKKNIAMPLSQRKYAASQA